MSIADQETRWSSARIYREKTLNKLKRMHSLQVLACIVLTLAVLSTTQPFPPSPPPPPPPPPPTPAADDSSQEEVFGDADSIARGSSDKESTVTQTEMLLVHCVFSIATGHFMAITRSGRVQAMAQGGKLH